MVPTKKRTLPSQVPFNIKNCQLNRRRLLRAVFNVETVETKNLRFTDQLTTNGYDVIVLLGRRVETTGSAGSKRASKRRKKDDGTAHTTSTSQTRSSDKMNEFEIELRKIGPNYDPEVLIGIDPGMKVLGTAVSVGSLSRRLAQNYGRSPGRHKRRKQSKWHNQHRHPKTRGEQILQPHQNHCRLYPDITERHTYRQPEQTIIQISNGIYRHMSKLNHFCFWHESLMKREPWYAEVLRAMPSFKTANYDRYFQQLEFAWKHLRFLIAFQDETSFVRWRFTRLRMKEMALDALAKPVVPVPSPAVCIAYGDWSRQDGIRGHANMPVQGLAKALKKRATVLPMDEFRTSQLCSSCHMRLKQARLLTKVQRKEDEVDVRLKENPSKKELKEIEEMSRWKKTLLKDFKPVLRCDRNVLRCTNSGCKAQLWNRDVNAARNMLYLLKRGLQGEHGPRRPLPFRRGK